MSLPAFAAEPQPIWASLGTLINDTPGNTPQQNPKIINDGESYIIAWEDGRNGYTDIYAQKVSGGGIPSWAKDGVAVCISTGNQNFPGLISDAAGGVIIVWQDYRNGNSDIFAQRISQSGQILWGKEGREVCAAAAGQFAPEIISDGGGGAIITWHDYRSAKGEDVYAQRIDYKGDVLFEKDGVAVSNAEGTQWYPKIAGDGTGGAIITWTDGRTGSADNNIYVQRIDSSGKALWQENGIAVSSAPQNQERPVILADQEGAIIAWNDSRSGNIDIYAQKVGLDGSLKWAAEGAAVCAAPYTQENPKIAADGAGGAIITWTDERVEESDVYAQRIYSNGGIAWQENGRPICKTEGKQKNPEIIKVNREWVIAWEDSREGNINLFIQKINDAGIPLWETNGVPFAGGRFSQESPVIAASASGNIVAAWQDRRFGNYDIYAQKISPSGTLLWDKGGIVICEAKGSVVQQKLELTNAGEGEIILVFEDARSGFFNIYAQKVSKNGTLLWGKDGIAVAKASANQTNPKIISDGAGGAIIAWEDHRIQGRPNIRAQRINSNGTRLWESSLLAAQSELSQTLPVITADGQGGAIIAWHDNRDVLNLQDIYAQRISSAGKLLFGKKGKKVIAANGEQTDMDMISDGQGGAILAWTDYRQGDRNPDIYAQRINAQGEALWKEEGVLICGAPDIQRTPSLIGDGEGGALIAWTDKGGGSYDIYAQRISKAGQTLWMTDGIPINQLSRTQQNPKFGNRKVLVWEDYRFGNWDIFAGQVDLSGKLIWGEAGIPIVSLPHTQYAPQVIQWVNGDIIAVWEDYRSGNQYELFVQKLNSDGKVVWDENGIKVQSKDGGRSPKIAVDPASDSFYVFWEDYTGGGKAIYGQRFTL